MVKKVSLAIAVGKKCIERTAFKGGCEKLNLRCPFGVYILKLFPSFTLRPIGVGVEKTVGESWRCTDCIMRQRSPRCFY
jgi:hypothetical protein